MGCHVPFVLPVCFPTYFSSWARRTRCRVGTVPTRARAAIPLPLCFLFGLPLVPIPFSGLAFVSAACAIVPAPRSSDLALDLSSACLLTWRSG